MHYHFALSVTKITFISLNSCQSNVHLNKLYTFYLHVQNNNCYIDIILIYITCIFHAYKETKCCFHLCM